MSINTTEKYRIINSEEGLLLQLSGNWRFQDGIPDIDRLLKQLLSTKPEELAFDCRQLGNWDSGLMTFLVRLINNCKENNIQTLQETLPIGVQNYSDYHLPFLNAK